MTAKTVAKTAAKIELLILSPRVFSGKAGKTLNMLENGLKKEALSFKISTFKEMEIFMEKGQLDIFFGGLNLNEFENIFFRKVGFNKELAFLISKLSIEKGINFIDKLYAQFYSSTKLTQTFLFHLKGINAPKTYFSPVYDEKKLIKAGKFLGFPFVAKECNTSQGAGVFLVENENQIKERITAFADKQIILQEFIENNFEYRVLIMGGEIVDVEKKTRDKNSSEFRNNVHLGATEEFLDVKIFDESGKELAFRASNALDIQIAGVDIIEDLKGNRFVTEVNSTPGFTHDEKISDEIPNLINFLKKWAKKSNFLVSNLIF